MILFEIKNYFKGKILFSLITNTFKLCVEAAVRGGADLRGADLMGADLMGADLRGANLRWADLREADLRWADLRGADLRDANLRGAEITFEKFPTITLLSSIALSNLSDSLTIELMRRDAYAHPKPESFVLWAKGGPCPYQNEDRFWHFNAKVHLWKKGKPKLTDGELIVEICKSQGWKIKNYLK